MSFVPLKRSQLEFIAEEFWPGGGEDGDGRDLYGVAQHHGVWREETTEASLIAEALHPADADYYDRHRVDEMDDEEFEKWLAEDDADGDETISVNDEPLDAFLNAHDDGELDDGPAVSDHLLDRGNGLVQDYGLDGEDEPDTLEPAAQEAVEFLVNIDPGRGYARNRHHREFYIGIETFVDHIAWSHLLSGPSYFAEDSSTDLDGVVPANCRVATALEHFTRDGITKIGMRYGVGSFGQYRDTRREHRPNIGPYLVVDPATGRYRPNPRWNGRQRFDSWKRHREAQYRTRHIDPRILDRAERRRNTDGTLWYLDPAVLYPRAA